MRSAVALRLTLLPAMLALAPLLYAADQSTVGVTSTAVGGTTKASTAGSGTTALSAADALVAQLWGLSPEEMQRANALLRGPRFAFSVQNLSPVEALGIHARNEQERKRYAELFARAYVADVERSRIWANTVEPEIKRLVGNQPVVSYGGLPSADVEPGIADGANVPRTLLRAGNAGERH